MNSLPPLEGLGPISPLVAIAGSIHSNYIFEVAAHVATQQGIPNAVNLPVTGINLEVNPRQDSSMIHRNPTPCRKNPSSRESEPCPVDWGDQAPPSSK